MTDEKRDLGRVAYEHFFGDDGKLPWPVLPGILKQAWTETAKAVAAIAREEGYREGLERAARYVEPWHYEFADEIRELKDEKR